MVSASAPGLGMGCPRLALREFLNELLCFTVLAVDLLQLEDGDLISYINRKLIEHLKTDI